MPTRLQCTSEQLRYSILNKPRINLDEVQRDLVLARGQVLERLLDVVRRALDIETTTDVAKRNCATARDFATVPALLIFGILEVRRDCLESWPCTLIAPGSRLRKSAGNRAEARALCWRASTAGCIAIPSDVALESR